MNYLRNKRVYLSAPIENATNESWNVVLKEFLLKMGVVIFDPAVDPKQQWVPRLKEMREKRDFDGIHEIASQFVRKDLCLVDRSDFVIAYLPYKVPTTGTVHEIINSNMSKKVTILFCPQGKEFISLWYFGFINHKYMFGSMTELCSYLKDVDQGLHVEDDRWAFVYGLI